MNILLTELGRSVWENLDLGRWYRPHCVRSVLATSVKILPYRPPARLIRAKVITFTFQIDREATTLISYGKNLGRVHIFYGGFGSEGPYSPLDNHTAYCVAPIDCLLFSCKECLISGAFSQQGRI